jgi:cation transport regulator
VPRAIRTPAGMVSAAALFIAGAPGGSGAREGADEARGVRLPGLRLRALPMPYASNQDLPDSVRSHLPPEAQNIFRSAFNRAFERHDEVVAFRIAWAAVKRRYEKVDGVWILREWS